ncbi:hypothetical protein ND748_03020 [Frankia sp. AiPs1]|uniref:hypothetical protein n=1 Tax=Frankia sp. AiPs1 TaxID=573493 RepID=UPI002044A590|nr:hypothetical protein [Frankia sp. AiPs1]MCM3920649.1 hypothetical protein [Frankia sp. AiPs1]
MHDPLWPQGGQSQPVLAPTGDIQPLIAMGKKLQAEATKHGIHNVFDDGGYKELLLLTLLDLKKLGRTGDDAADSLGRQYEIKTVARVSSRGVRKTSLGITTEHTLTIENIERYRRVHLWIVAVFDQAAPESIYEIAPSRLETFFGEWERKIRDQISRGVEGSAPPHLNNPKIPLKFVINNGVCIWPLLAQDGVPRQQTLTE